MKYEISTSLCLPHCSESKQNCNFTFRSCESPSGFMNRFSSQRCFHIAFIRRSNQEVTVVSRCRTLLVKLEMKHFKTYAGNQTEINKCSHRKHRHTQPPPYSLTVDLIGFWRGGELQNIFAPVLNCQCSLMHQLGGNGSLL